MSNFSNSSYGRPANAAVNVWSRSLGSPALGTAAAVLAATAAAAPSVVTAGLTNPDVPRNVTATPGGTTANVLAVQAIVAGTDVNGVVITETLPAFTAGAATAVTGSKAFATVTSVSLPACGSAVTVAVGVGAKLGMPQTFARDTISDAYLNAVREGTRPTLAKDAANVSGNTLTLNSALNGTPVVVDFRDGY